ncbi:MAG TPA: Flp pilus assembly protein CpaB [Terriglobales bacterium]|nr:Flp pilus assembly protein CpaB [Terriglobales bacterium]
MNRTRLMFIGLIALALGGLLSTLVYKRLQASAARPSKPGVEVVVAANDLQVGTKLDDRDLRVVNFPAEGLPDGVIHQKARAIGRGVLQPISRGEFILTNKLADKDVAGLPALIPPGMRAVSVRVNDVIAVSGFVVPGTRVDVLLTGNPGAGESVNTTVLQNVAVLASGQKLERNAAGEPQASAVITLLVSPEDAQKLTLASQEGRIQLTLRNPLDTGQEKIAAVRNAALYNGGIPAPASTPPRTPTRVKHLAPSPAPSRPTPYTIEVIRGNEKKEVNFEQ